MNDKLNQLCNIANDKLLQFIAKILKQTFNNMEDSKATSSPEAFISYLLAVSSIFVSSLVLTSKDSLEIPLHLGEDWLKDMFFDGINKAIKEEVNLFNIIKKRH